MKRITTAVLFFIPINVFSQPEIKNISLTVPDSSILYIGIENKIEVTGIKDKPYLRLKSGKGEIIRHNLNPFLFLLTVTGKDSDVVELYENNNLVFTKTFSVRKLADPVPVFGTLADSVATVDEIILNPVINVLLPGCYYKHSYRVIYFKATVLSSKGRVDVFDKEGGNRLTKDQLKSIKQLKKGNKILLTEITATCFDCANRRLRDLTITIKAP